MESIKIHGKNAFAAVLFVASVFIIGTKLLHPTPVQIFIEGSEITVRQTPLYSFTFIDVAIFIIAAAILSASAIYLLFFDRFQNVENPGKDEKQENNAGEIILEERKDRWREISKNLKNDEQKIYEIILDAGGIVEQSEIVEKSGISKSSVSRILDLLESKNLVDRRRRGMGNVILLK